MAADDEMTMDEIRSQLLELDADGVNAFAEGVANGLLNFANERVMRQAAQAVVPDRDWIAVRSRIESLSEQEICEFARTCHAELVEFINVGTSRNQLLAASLFGQAVEARKKAAVASAARRMRYLQIAAELLQQAKLLCADAETLKKIDAENQTVVSLLELEFEAVRLAQAEQRELWLAMLQSSRTPVKKVITTEVGARPITGEGGGLLTPEGVP
jgi:hypothetical protein